MGIRDDQFWAEFFGIESSAWNVPGVSIRPHAGLNEYRGLWCFRRRDHIVVSAPPGWVIALNAALHDDDGAHLFDESFLRELVGDDFDCLIGPAFQGCLDPRRFRPVVSPNVRTVESTGDAAVMDFRDRCEAANWANSGLDKARGRVAAYFEGSVIRAVAGYRPWNDNAGDPCVITHPEFYGRGYGTAVVSGVVDRALREGKLLLYQTLEANRAAIRIALKLGYEQYARHVAVRLRYEKPSIWPDLGIE